MDAACATALRTKEGLLAWHDGSLGRTTAVADTYHRRAEHLKRRGIQQLGADEFTKALRGYPARELLLVEVHTTAWNFVVAMTADEAAVISSMAVDAAVAEPDWDYTKSHKY